MFSKKAEEETSAKEKNGEGEEEKESEEKENEEKENNLTIWELGMASGHFPISTL